MKKSTILIIFIIYLASIVAIGFFGMKIKVYDEIKYVKTIDLEVVSSIEDSYKFEYLGVQTQASGVKTKKYQLQVKFDKAQIGSFVRNSGIEEDRYYIDLTILPKVTYDTGDVASEEENIKYRISNQNLINKEQVSLSENGFITFFKRSMAFFIYVEPASNSGTNAGVVIEVFVS